MIVRDAGVMPYAAALRLQEELVRSVRAGGEETLLLLEHLPVYTIGAGGRSENVLDPSLEALRVNRGGDVTYHGPGQLVGYPILDLSRRGQDLHCYLRFLEHFLMRIAGMYRVATRTVDGKTGVWTERGKLASLGVGVRHWVSMHGFALNVSLDLSPFQSINPCGFAGCPVTSLALELGEVVSVAAVKELVGTQFPRILEERLPRKQGAERMISLA